MDDIEIARRILEKRARKRLAEAPGDDEKKDDAAAGGDAGGAGGGGGDAGGDPADAVGDVDDAGGAGDDAGADDAAGGDDAGGGEDPAAAVPGAGDEDQPKEGGNADTKKLADLYRIFMESLEHLKTLARQVDVVSSGAKSEETKREANEMAQDVDKTVSQVERVLDMSFTPESEGMIDKVHKLLSKRIKEHYEHFTRILEKSYRETKGEDKGKKGGPDKAEKEKREKEPDKR